VAGAGAAAVWAAVEPLASRALRTGYTDVRLLGAAVTTGRAWPLVGGAAHVANGAVFGAVFARLGGRGAMAGVAAAQVENAVLWPAFRLVEGWHPDTRSGRWPHLSRNRRILAQEVLVHALFGALLGAAVRD
jgi:hypothetical protein